MARKKFEDKQYCISGRVIDKASRQGLAGLRVEAWNQNQAQLFGQ